MDISLPIDDCLLNAERDQPHVYAALSNFFDITLIVITQTDISLKFSQELFKTYIKEIEDYLEAFKLELEDDSDLYEDSFPSYKGTQSAFFIDCAYLTLSNNDVDFLTKCPINERYIKSKGKITQSYQEALDTLPAEGTPFYEVTKESCIEAKKSLEDIKAVRTLLTKLFNILPKDTYRYDDIKKLYEELMSLYAYDTVFVFYYM